MKMGNLVHYIYIIYFNCIIYDAFNFRVSRHKRIFPLSALLERAFGLLHEFVEGDFTASILATAFTRSGDDRKRLFFAFNLLRIEIRE